MGISYNVAEGTFIFDFNHDGVTDVIPLTLHGCQVEAFGKCFYYGYEFADDVDGNVRSAFIKHLKFPAVLKEDPDLTHFIQKAYRVQTLFSWMGYDSKSMLYGLDHVQELCETIDGLS